MTVKDIPIGRIAKVASKLNSNLYVFRTYGFLFRLYPATSDDVHTIEGGPTESQKYMTDWECELLPETATVTINFNGKGWTLRDRNKN